VPFDVTLPDWISGKPSVEEPNFITWETPDAPPVRFLVPVKVYPPGKNGANSPPDDYLKYLLGQTQHGAVSPIKLRPRSAVCPPLFSREQLSTASMVRWAAQARGPQRLSVSVFNQTLH
jgi:hypothetical protein